MNTSKGLLFPLLTMSLIPMLALAGSTGKISGRVTDEATGEDLVGVTVLVEGTGRGAVTDIGGRYVILNVPSGHHTVIVSIIGYKRFQMRDVRVSVDFTTKLDFELEEGNIEVDEIVVIGERSPLIRQDLTNPVASISDETIRELPVTEIGEIIGLQAGITVDDDGSIHIRGGLGNEIAYTLNGMNINNPYGNSRSVGLATNAVQEVSVSSGTFSAEYGSALSGVVNYVTKEGARSWTGGLRYFTGDHVSSRDELFFNIDDQDVANVYRVEASLGGPLIGEELSFYGSGVYNWNGGYIYGQRIYLPQDAFLSREGFPSGDPRRGGATDPLYFGPLLHDSTDLVGGPSGDGAIVPLNWSRSYNLQGNLSYRLSPEMRLKYEIVFDNEERPHDGLDSQTFESRFKPDGRLIRNDESYFQSLEWTHSIGEKMFYTVKGSYIIDIQKRRAFDRVDDYLLPEFYLRRLQNTLFYTGGVDLHRFYRKTETVAGKFDLVAQVFDDHEVKFGLEVRSHKLNVEDYELEFQDDPSFSDKLVNSDIVFTPIIPTVPGGYVNYTHHPLQMAAYIQDKIELFNTIILNLGVRYEYFKPDADFNPAISEELSLQDTILLQKNLQEATVKNMVSPRISVSYPITDRGTIRFSYGHFYQIGSLSELYRNPNFRAPRTDPRFGNPDVNPQKSIQYEIGLQQGLTENLKIEVTGYYKDVSDYIFTQRIITARGDLEYRLLTNLNYANTRGISISMLKRRSANDILSASIDYTFQIADGNRTEPEEEFFFSEQQGQPSETFLVPFDHDRSHTITSTVTLSQPNNWAVSMIGWFRTGTPYTPDFPSNIVPIKFTQNSDQQVVQWNVDLKIEKFFQFGALDYSLFLQVDNLFDTENETEVYAASGRALFTISPTSFGEIRGRINRGDPGLIPISAIDNYYARPENVNQPRLVRIGASVFF